MALIHIPNKVNDSYYNDEHSIIKLDANTRTFSGIQDYVVAVAGDNNSQILLFELPLEYDGVPFYGTNIKITYWTSWLDDSEIPVHSSGVITAKSQSETDGSDFPLVYFEKTIEVNGTTQEKLYCSWILDKKQTAKPGQCLFKFSFELDNIDGSGNTEIITYNWTSLAGSFTILDSGFLPGGPFYIADNEYYTKKEIDNKFEQVDSLLGDISAALDELHAYAQNLVNGGAN